MKFNSKKIVIAGGTGFLGKAVVNKFCSSLDDNNIIKSFGSKEYDLRHYRDAEEAFQGADLVILLSADAGGILYNRKNPGQLFYNNMSIGLNTVESCRKNGVKKLMLTGTVCAYPKYTKVPFKEDTLWDGYPEETNAPYGVSKRSLLTLAKAYRQQYGLNAIYLLIVNLYGPHDHFFEEEKSHVIPALIRKFVEAKENGKEEVVLWGTGSASREFLFVDDAAEAIFLASKLYDKHLPVNVGAGFEITIKELAEKIRNIVGYEGNIVWDDSYPDGQPRRCLDVSKAKEYFNFEAKTDFDTGLRKTIEWYKENRERK